MYPNQQPYGQTPMNNNMPPYGAAPYGNQQYNPGYGPGPNQYNSAPPNMMGPQPVYRQITCGQGIDMNEFNSIVDCCKWAFTTGGMNGLSGKAADAIRQRLGGDWFVFISTVGVEDFDFSMTRVKGGDFMAFSLDNTKFQVCRIR